MRFSPQFLFGVYDKYFELVQIDFNDPSFEE